MSNPQSYNIFLVGHVDVLHKWTSWGIKGHRPGENYSPEVSSKVQERLGPIDSASQGAPLGAWGEFAPLRPTGGLSLLHGPGQALVLGDMGTLLSLTDLC